MSKTVDERVVDMQFNNGQFESNVKTSIDSIDKLKKSLDFKDAGKSFDGLSDSAKKFSLAGIAEGVDAIAGKFTTLGIIGVTALTNIANKAVDAGLALVKNLTIDQVIAGFTKYESKTKAVQTIMSATGKTVDEVNESLEKLNWFTDETSYNFTDMVSNIGKFTAQGIDLDVAVTAMEGIANWAALSGQGVNEASRAMYNLSQAIGVGAVKLMDWRSIENANMGTKEFKETVIETAKALGMLDQNGKTFKGTMVDFSNFSSTLAEGWFTSDVLIASLDKYGNYANEVYKVATEEGLTAAQAMERVSSATMELGSKAFRAAQEAKTFTDAIEATKDAVSTGWMSTFEIIFGNYEEAKRLWTDLANGMYDVFAAEAESRNEMLQTWKDLGGRDSMIQSFKNLAAAVGSIVEPIKAAFREIFPALTGERLAQITKSFEKFTEKLKIGEGTAEKIKTVFKGLFSLLSIGAKLFSAVAKGAKDLVTFLSPAAKALLGYGVSLADWVSSVNDSIKANDTFMKGLETLKTFISNTATVVKEGFKKMVEAFESLTGLDMTNLNTFLTSLREQFHPIQKLGEVIHKSFTWISDVFKKVGPVLSKIGGKIGEAFKSMNFNGILQLLTSGTLISAIAGIKKLVDSFREISDKAGGFLESITGILDGVRDALKAYENDLKAGTLLKIAAAIAILAGALMVLSLIDANKLTGALTAVTVLFGELMGAMAIFDSIVSGKKFSSLTRVTTSLILFSTAVLILSKAVAELSGLSWDQLNKGLLSLSVIMAALVVVSRTMSTESAGMIKTSIALLALSGVIKILVTAVESLGSMDTGKLVQGLLAMLAVMAELVLFTQFVKSSLTIEDALGLVAIAVAVRLIASAIQKIGEMDIAQVIVGITGMTAAMGELILFTKMVDKSGGLIQAAAGLAIFGAAMLILASAVEKLGSIPIETIGQGFAFLTLILTTVTIALNLMPKDMVATGLGLLAVSAGLVLMAAAMRILAGMTWEEVAKGLIAMGGALLILVVALNAMTGSLAGAAAILLVSVALMGLAVAMNLLGAMPIEAVGIALLALVAVLVIFGVASAVLTPVIPLMLALGAALLLLGVAMLAIGASTIVLGIGLSTLAASGMEGIAILLSLTLALAPLILLSPGLLLLGAALVVLSVGIMLVGAALTVLAVGMGVIMALGPGANEALIALASTSAQISEYAVELLVAGAALIVFGAGAIVAGAGALVASVGLLAISLALQMLQKIDFTKFEGIGSMAAEFLAASGSLLLASPGLLAGGAALTVFGNGAQTTGDGLHSINDSIQSIIDLMNTMPDTIRKATNAIVAAVNQLISQVTSAIRTHKSIIEANVAEVLNAALNKVKSYVAQFKAAGMAIGQGLADGINASIPQVAAAAAALAAAAASATTNKLEINSPSKVFEDIGKNSVLGFVNAFLKYTPLAVSAATEMGHQSFEPVLAMSDNVMLGAMRAGSGLQRMAEKAMSMTPTFTAEKETVVRHTFDPLTVKGVNDRGEFVAAADYSVEKMLASMMRRQNRT